MGRGRPLRLAFALAVATALATSAAAQGAVTIGSNLGRAPDVQLGCDPSCTEVGTSLTSDAVAPAGLVSPVNGTVVTWRIRVSYDTAPTALRVITRLPGNFAVGAGTSAAVVPALGATSAFPTQLPIATGQSIGVDCCQGGEAIGVTGGSGTLDTWLPALPDGGAPQHTFQFSPTSPYELAINADIEPTSAFRISQVKPGKGGKVTVTATLPNPGTLVAGDQRDAGLATAAAGKKKAKNLKRASLPVGVAGQTIRLLVKPTKRAHTLLAEKGRLKAGLKVVFTPTGGTASTQLLKVKLKN
jgi:hypothetical protein